MLITTNRNYVITAFAFYSINYMFTFYHQSLSHYGTHKASLVSVIETEFERVTGPLQIRLAISPI